VRKFTGLCVQEELEHRNGNLPRARQDLMGALHARSPVTLRKKDRGAYAQVSVVLRERLAPDDIHPVSSDLGDLGVVISLDWQFR